MPTPIKLGFSPCPNDTFVFDALVNGRIDPGELEFEPIILDIEELNQAALRGDVHVVKVSYHAYAYLIDQYVLLESGSALGKNCGPILITNSLPEDVERSLSTAEIAIPGQYTTANFLLNLAFPKAQNKKVMVFSEIEDAVLSGNAEYGLIIHENRFTYEDRGLKKVMDLGEFWETKTGLPIPLGGIIAKRELSHEDIKKINDLIRQSIEYARSHPEESKTFVAQHSQSMDEDVRQRHIDLYVNDFTLGLGEEGRKAVETLFEIAEKEGVVPKRERALFE